MRRASFRIEACGSPMLKWDSRASFAGMGTEAPRGPVARWKPPNSMGREPKPCSAKPASSVALPCIEHRSWLAGRPTACELGNQGFAP